MLRAIHLSLLLLCGFTLSAQNLPSARRVYFVGNRCFVTDSLGTTSTDYDASQVSVSFYPNLPTPSIRLRTPDDSGYLRPNQFLKSSGLPWGISVTTAFSAWNDAVGSLAGVGGGTGGGTSGSTVAVANDLITNDATRALAAPQGGALKSLIDGNTSAIGQRLLTTTFNSQVTIQQGIDNAQNSNITANANAASAAQATANAAQPKETGKGLSSNDYTAADKVKVTAITPPTTSTTTTQTGTAFDAVGAADLAQRIANNAASINARRIKRLGIQGNLPVVLSRFGGYNSGFFTTDSARRVMTYRWYFVPTVTVTSLRLTFGNWELSKNPNSTGGGATNAITVKASFHGPLQPITFYGNQSVSIPPGVTVISDFVDQTFQAGQAYLVYVSVSVATVGMKWPLGITMISGTNDGTATGDNTSGGGSYTNSTNAGYHPIAIFGVPVGGSSNTGTVMIHGTSIGAGRSGGETNDYGWVRRGLDGAGVSWGRLAVGGGKMTNLAAASGGGAYVPVNTLGYDYIITEIGGANDLATFSTLSAAQTEFIRYWTFMFSTGSRLYQPTVLPRNDWSATVKQIKNDLNDWFRDGAPMQSGAAVAIGTTGAGVLRAGQIGHPLWGYIEAADLAETARNSNVWKTNYSGDGVHPSVTGATAIGAAISAIQFPVP